MLELMETIILMVLLNAYWVLDTISGSFTMLPYSALTKAQWEKTDYPHLV